MRWFFIIVGVDFGVCSAVAVLDFGGRLVALKSKRNWPKAELYQFISQFSPTVLASDRNPAPSELKKMTAFFAAKLFKPKNSLGVHDKNRCVRTVGTRNAHERDAYAAAKKAYDVLCSNKMRHLDKKLKERATASLKASVIRGMRTDRALKAERNVYSKTSK